MEKLWKVYALSHPSHLLIGWVNFVVVVVAIRVVCCFYVKISEKENECTIERKEKKNTKKRNEYDNGDEDEEEWINFAS